jgi:hypothetical protein
VQSAELAHELRARSQHEVVRVREHHLCARRTHLIGHEALDRRFRADIMAWRKSMADTPRKADYHVTVLRALLGWGRVQGQLALNVADGIPNLYKGGGRAHIVWTPDEVALLHSVLPTQLQDALDLARLTGLRRGDLVKLPLSAFGPHAIVWRTSKSNGERVVTVPMLPALADLVAALR